MHSTGHTSAQAPQLVQASSSMILIPSFFAEMASTGHSGSQAPQAVHSSALILYAIVNLHRRIFIWFKNSVDLFYTKKSKMSILETIRGPGPSFNLPVFIIFPPDNGGHFLQLPVLFHQKCLQHIAR